MYMLVKKDKEKALQLLKDGKIIDLLPYVPQLADEIAVNAEKQHKFISAFDDSGCFSCDLQLCIIWRHSYGIYGL